MGRAEVQEVTSIHAREAIRLMLMGCFSSRTS